MPRTGPHPEQALGDHFLRLSNLTRKPSCLSYYAHTRVLCMCPGTHVQRVTSILPLPHSPRSMPSSLSASTTHSATPGFNLCNPPLPSDGPAQPGVLAPRPQSSQDIYLGSPRMRGEHSHFTWGKAAKCVHAGCARNKGLTLLLGDSENSGRH